MIRRRHPVRFAWLPVRLAEFRAPYWHRTRRWAWLVRVEAVASIWGETYYRRPPAAQPEKEPRT